jgi:hypothetical protein
LQSLKAAFSMGGNIAALDAAGDGGGKTRALFRALGDLCLYQVVAPLFGARMHERKAARVEKMSLIDVRAEAGLAALG